MVFALKSMAAKDAELVDPPPDSVSKLAFSPVANILAVGSWDNGVRMYEINDKRESRPVAMYSHDGPVLDLAWSKDGQYLFSAGGDNKAYMYDTRSQQKNQVAMHEKPIKCVRYVEVNGQKILLTVGWDMKMHCWDMQSSNPIRSVPFKAQVCAMDANDRFAVVCTADRQAHIFELASMQSRQVETGLNWPARVVSFFPSSVNCDLFAIGSIEGRVRIQAVMEGAKTPNESRIMRDANFSYKCHRHAHLAPVKAPGKSDSQHVFPVNALAHHPNGTYCTGGGDGSLTFWDGLGRSKNKTYSTTDLGNGDPLKAATGTPCMPIVSAAYNNTGDILAYAFSYDWAKGHDGVPAGAKAARIMLHAITAEEKKSKVKI